MARSYLPYHPKTLSGNLLLRLALLSKSFTAWITAWSGRLLRTTGWRQVHPLITMTYDFLDVFLVNEDIGFAVGKEGIIFKTVNGGINWNQLVHNETTEDLWGVHFANNLIGYAVGNAGTILRTDDGGASWTVRTHYLGSSVNYRDVFVFDGQKAIIVGGSNIYRLGEDLTYTYLPGYILLTEDGGLTWSAPGEVPTEVPWLEAIDMASATTGTIVGGCAHHSPLGQAFRSSVIMRTKDGGQTWSLQNNPCENTVQPHLDLPLDAVDFYEENVGIAGSIYASCIYTSDGETWLNSTYNMDVGCGYWQTGVSFLDANTAIFVGFDKGAAGILKSTDAGKTWTEVNYGTYTSLFGVSFGSSTRGVAVGKGSMVVRSDDGGETWQPSSDFQPAITSEWEDLRALFFSDASNGYAIGWFGTILRTIDGGASWQRVLNKYNYLKALYFHDSQNGFIGGERGLFRTFDGCATLQEFLSDDYGQTFSILRPADASYGCPGVNGIDFGDPQTGVWIGNEIIYQTTDGGAIWHKVSLTIDLFLGMYFNDVQFVSSGTVIIVGTKSGWGGTVLRSTDAGTTWQRQDLPNPLRWSPGDLRAASLRAIHFPKGQDQVGYAVGDSATIIKTDDGGIAWRSLEPKIGGRSITGHWNNVFFLNELNGWIVGNEPEQSRAKGIILHTTDGGTTWERQDTPTPETLDGRSLRDVCFVTDTKGTAVGGGGLIIHTTTGGM